MDFLSSFWGSTVFPPPPFMFVVNRHYGCVLKNVGGRGQAPPRKVRRGESTTTTTQRRGKEAGKQHRPQRGRGEGESNISTPVGWRCLHLLFVGGAAFPQLLWGGAAVPSSIGVVWCCFSPLGWCCLLLPPHSFFKVQDKR